MKINIINIERMKKVLNQPSIKVPDGLSRKELRAFINGSYNKIDIERMKKVLNQPSIKVPDGLSREELRDFIINGPNNK